MSTLGAIIALILGLLLVFVWGVHIIVQILGWILVAAAAIWLLKYLVGDRTRI